MIQALATSILANVHNGEVKDSLRSRSLRYR
jgi:hypothetical protein